MTVAYQGRQVTVILPIGRPGPQAMYEANSSVEVVVLEAKELGDFEKVRAMVHADGTGEVRWAGDNSGLTVDIYHISHADQLTVALPPQF